MCDSKRFSIKNMFSHCSVFQALLPLLKTAASSAENTNVRSAGRASIINITSKMGSVADASGGNYGYRMAKVLMSMCI